MQDLVMDLVAARRGHFLLESGHHGELWLDLDAVFWSVAALDPVVDALAGRLAGTDAVCGPLAGGAFLAQLVAARLGVGFAYTERISAGAGARSTRRATSCRPRWVRGWRGGGWRSSTM